MRHVHIAVIIALLGVAGWIGTAQAQSQQDQAQQQAKQAQQDAQRAQQQAQQAQQQAQQGAMSKDPGFISGGQGGQQQLPLVTGPSDQLIQGQVIKTEDKDINNQEHRFVHLKTKQGQTIMVDLGLTDNFPRGFEVKENQWVLVAGRQDRVGDQTMFVAHTFANVYNLGTKGGGVPATDRDREGGAGGSVEDKNGSYRAQYRGYGEGTGTSTGAGGQTQYEEDKPGHTSDQQKSHDKD